MEKIDGILNSGLPFVIVVVMNHPTVTGFLIDDGSSCNILYEEALKLVGLYWTEPTPSEGEEILAFNNSVTHPSREIDITSSVGEETRKRTMTLTFLMILCKTSLKVILVRSFLAKLDVVVSPIHLKIAYHDKK